MMRTKERSFALLVHVSLEELVPRDHFYQQLEKSLDLSFVREFVQETYAGGGRPSIDPVVFFKLQLVMFFEGLRSERQLMRHAADRLSVRWFVGYDLGEPLPDHSREVKYHPRNTMKRRLTAPFHRISICKFSTRKHIKLVFVTSSNGRKVRYNILYSWLQYEKLH